MLRLIAMNVAQTHHLRAAHIISAEKVVACGFLCDSRVSKGVLFTHEHEFIILFNNCVVDSAKFS
jgi:hypothetical protein